MGTVVAEPADVRYSLQPFTVLQAALSEYPAPAV
jgi:hypothetical protein